MDKEIKVTLSTSFGGVGVNYVKGDVRPFAFDAARRLVDAGFGSVHADSADDYEAALKEAKGDASPSLNAEDDEAAKAAEAAKADTAKNQTGKNGK